MKEKVLKNGKNTLIMLLIFGLTFLISFLLEDIVEEHISTVFVFAVFLVSLFTDGYFYGILTAFLSVMAINFAFTYPSYFLILKEPTQRVGSVFF